MEPTKWPPPLAQNGPSWPREGLRRHLRCEAPRREKNEPRAGRLRDRGGRVVQAFSCSAAKFWKWGFIRASLRDLRWWKAKGNGGHCEGMLGSKSLPLVVGKES